MTEHNQSKYYIDPYPTQNMDSYNNPYKFNGKEMDKETGMYYYGARYYDPRISIFVSVDPLAEEFVGWTPYHYVHQNPINLIDPTGMAADPPPGTGYRQGYTSTDEDGVTWKLEGKVWQNLSGGEDQWQEEALDELVIDARSRGDGIIKDFLKSDVGKLGIPIGDFMSGGQVSDMEESLHLYETEGFNSYIYS